MNKIYLNNKPIVLIDCSYYIFYRYYGTSKWFENNDTSVIARDLSPEYVKAFTKHFHQDIKKLITKYKTIQKNIYMCVDCLRCDIWRNKYCEVYKGTRQHTESFNRDIFDKFKLEINTCLKQIQSDNMEADDIIAILHQQIRKTKPSQNIVVISNDNDYLQLLDNKTKINNMQFKDISERKSEDSIREHLIVKCFTGDKSDNIPRLTGITKKKALELCKMNSESLDNWLNEMNLYNKFYNNMKLISFKHIPNEVSYKLINNIEFIYDIYEMLSNIKLKN